MTTNDVAKTILEQIEKSFAGSVSIKTGSTEIGTLGFGALELMGAHTFVYDEKSVQFGIKARTKDFNKVVVSLNEKDLYDVELWLCKILNKEPYLVNEKIDEYNDVDASELGNLLVKESVY